MPLILGTNSIKDTGYNVDNSLRFNSAGPDDLSKTFGTATDTKKWTCSFWWKPAIAAAQQQIFSVTNGTADDTFFHIQYRDNVEIRLNGYNTNWLTTNRKFRDYSAWYHVVVSADSTQGTAANRLKLYINGTEETSFATDNRGSISEDQTWGINLAQPHFIGSEAGGGSGVSGYLSEFVMIDGLRLDPTSFGEFDSDSGIWKPINVSSLTFGNNGFYQEYKQAGTGTNSSGMGADTSGNGNHIAVSNLAAVDQSTDTCTNNFATLNPLSKVGSATFSNGNLTYTYVNDSGTAGTMGVTKGKWYWEYKFEGSANVAVAGIVDASIIPTTNINNTGTAGYYPLGNSAWKDTTEVTTGLSGYSDGMIIGLAFDADNGDIYTWVNGTAENSGSAIITGLDTTKTWLPFTCTGTPTINLNFGSPPFAISSGNADGNGYGNFEYAVPSGYYALNTKNLAEFG